MLSEHSRRVLLVLRDFTRNESTTILIRHKTEGKKEQDDLSLSLFLVFREKCIAVG